MIESICEEDFVQYNVIIGLPRSGTTLLSLILNETSFFCSSSEMRVMDSLIFPILDLIESDKNLILSNSLFGFTSHDILRTFCLAESKRLAFIAEVNGKELFVDKSCYLIERLDEIRALFGERIKIVFIIRDPRDVLCSLMEHPNTLPMNYRGACLRPTELVKYIHAAFHAMISYWTRYPNDTIVIKYETLIENQQHELKRVGDFLVGHSMAAVGTIKSIRHDRMFGSGDPGLYFGRRVIDQNSLRRWKRSHASEGLSSAFCDLALLAVSLGY